VFFYYFLCYMLDKIIKYKGVLKMLLQDTIEEFLLELDIRRASKEIIRSYKNALKVFKEFMGDNNNLLLERYIII